MTRLDEIDAELDLIHDNCPPSAGSCWCCCIDCTDRDDIKKLRDEYWALVIAAKGHILGEPRQLSYPGGKDGMWVVDCHCGYQTGPYAQPSQARRSAEAHATAKREAAP